jgi:3-dehydroquinate dehydratase/shikimate dehydrogenase
MSLDVDKICVIIGRTRHKMVTVELVEAYNRGARFIELRIDFLAKAVDFQRLLPNKKCPWIATLRRRDDGGRYTGTETERKTMIRQAIVSGFDWVDLETDIANEIPRFRDVKRIISYHNLKETPADLEQIYEKMAAQDADVLKLAVMANKPEDNLRVLDLIKNAKKPTVGHCMGDIGFPSRILALKYGAPFLYAAFNKERGIAPGLPSYEELRRFYHIPSIKADTEVFGLLGDPVAHSYSPMLHNQLFQQEGINAVYLPFRVPRGDLQATIHKLDTIPVRGYSVTIPHKEGAAALAKECDALVSESSAANTLIRRNDGFFAANTDYDAALDSLKDVTPTGDDNVPKDFAHCTALVLGAGGAARAVVRALQRLKTHILIASRTMERAEELAEQVHGRAVEWGARHTIPTDIVVNCTPIGMHPNVDESPLHASFLRPGMIVFDTVYNPERTMLVSDARARECKVVTGVEMFIRQAASQFQLFTGRTAPLDRLREMLRKAISPLTQKLEDLEGGDGTE